jgi:5-methylcytosine-specific restriction protein A
VAEKRKAAKAAGALACEVCRFNFELAYGALGAGYIEVHHTKPVYMMKPGAKTKLSDLALLCSNCHRMAHRKRIPLSLEDLRKQWKVAECLRKMNHHPA